MLTLLTVSALPVYVYASSPTFSATAAPAKTAYYIGEDIQTNFELEWTYLTQNYTVDIELWNSTSKITDLETSYLIDGTHYANSSYSTTYTTSDLTEEVTTNTYIVKVVESSTDLTIASAPFNFVVQSKSIAMSVAWNDANQDRTIEPAETVTFDIYLTWAFANETTSATLYVSTLSFEQIVDTVSITAGSGSLTNTYITSFDAKGTSTLTFSLKNTESETLATKTVSLTVGDKDSTTTASTTNTNATSILDTIWELKYIIVVFIGFVLVAFLLLKRK
ncbi:MAG: hypothetical protein ACOWW1_09740 [archaeon]